MDEQLPIADIPQGFFEYRAGFKEPIFATWFNRQNLLKDMYTALLPWGIDLERVSGPENPRNLKEAQITFALQNPAVQVTIGIGGITIVARDADWSEAPTLVSLFRVVLDNVLRITEAEIEAHQTVLGFHVKPGPLPFCDVMRQFVNAKALGKEDVSMLGVGLYSPDYSLVMDSSAALADGLFVKITRVFPAATGFEEMASILWKDEEGLLHRLGFRARQ